MGHLCRSWVSRVPPRGQQRSHLHCATGQLCFCLFWGSLKPSCPGVSHQVGQMASLPSAPPPLGAKPAQRVAQKVITVFLCEAGETCGTPWRGLPRCRVLGAGDVPSAAAPAPGGLRWRGRGWSLRWRWQYCTGNCSHLL